MTQKPQETKVLSVPEQVTHPVQAPPVQQAVTLWGTDNPAAVIERAAAIAGPLGRLIRDQHLYSTIGGREHVRVEGWTLLGSMLGVFPVCVWSRKLNGEGWEARVEARTRDGAIIGAAEASCLRSERNWKDRDDYALRSMAQTRATSKALRLPLGFVIALAGYDPTPEEEMPQDASKSGRTPSASFPAAKSVKSNPDAKSTENTESAADQHVTNGDITESVKILTCEEGGTAKNGSKWYKIVVDGKVGEYEVTTWDKKYAEQAIASPGQQASLTYRMKPGAGGRVFRNVIALSIVPEGTKADEIPF